MGYQLLQFRQLQSPGIQSLQGLTQYDCFFQGPLLGVELLCELYPELDGVHYKIGFRLNESQHIEQNQFEVVETHRRLYQESAQLYIQSYVSSVLGNSRIVYGLQYISTQPQYYLFVVSVRIHQKVVQDALSPFNREGYNPLKKLVAGKHLYPAELTEVLDDFDDQIVVQPTSYQQGQKSFK